MGAPENPHAFPVAWPSPNAPESGMTLRDWFAGQALAAVVPASYAAAEARGMSLEMAARAAAVGAYQIAGAMLAERAKGGGA